MGRILTINNDLEKQQIINKKTKYVNV